MLGTSTPNRRPPSSPSLRLVDCCSLLPPVRSLDGITGGVPLNCTEAGSDGESTGNYDCSYAPISREGWAVYNDAEK